MTKDTITDPLLDFVVRIIPHKFYQSNRLNSVPYIVVDVAYKLLMKDHTYDLKNLMLQQLNENLGAMRKSKGAQCKFGSALVCIFFYVMMEFPSFGKVNWSQNKKIVDQINDFIAQMGDSFDDQMTIYFDDFKNAMKKRMRILVSLVNQHENEICFLVDIDYTYIQAVLPRVRWLRPLGYELDVDQASATIIALLVEKMDKTTKAFGTYDTVRSRVVTELKTTIVVKKKDKLVKKIKKKFGVEETSEIGEVEEISEDEEEDEDELEQGPLELTQGQGEDKYEDVEEEEAKEAPIKGKAIKRKEKTPLASHPTSKKATRPTPKKPITKATTRASTQKSKKEAITKKKASKKAQEEPRKRKRYVAQLNTDEEDKSEKVSHPSKSSVDTLCEKIKNGDLSDMENIDFNKFTKEEQNRIEELVYAMMT